MPVATVVAGPRDPAGRDRRAAVIFFGLTSAAGIGYQLSAAELQALVDAVQVLCVDVAPPLLIPPIYLLVLMLSYTWPGRHCRVGTGWSSSANGRSGSCATAGRHVPARGQSIEITFRLDGRVSGTGRADRGIRREEPGNVLHGLRRFRLRSSMRTGRQFSGSERTVAEYLLAEVLDRQSEAVRRLLLRQRAGPGERELAGQLTGATASAVQKKNPQQGLLGLFDLADGWRGDRHGHAEVSESEFCVCREFPAWCSSPGGEPVPAGPRTPCRLPTPARRRSAR